MTMKHPLSGQYIYKYIYGECMTFDEYSFDKIISIDSDFITFANAKVILKGTRWQPSDEVGTNTYKVRIMYAKKGTKAKKDKDKLYENAINNLNLKLYKEGMFELYYPSYNTKDGFILEGN